MSWRELDVFSRFGWRACADNASWFADDEVKGVNFDDDDDDTDEKRWAADAIRRP